MDRPGISASTHRSRRSCLGPLILAALLGAPAGAHELIPGAALEGFPFSSPAAVAVAADGRDLYAAGTVTGGDPLGGFTVAPTSGLVWLRRDPVTGALNFKRNYLSRGGDEKVFGAVLDAAGEHLFLLTTSGVVTARRDAEGGLSLAASAALPAGLEPQRIALLPDGQIFVGGTTAAAIYALQGDGAVLRGTFLGDPEPRAFASVVAPDLFFSGSAAFRLLGGVWTRADFTSEPNEFLSRREIDRSPDGRYFYQLSADGELPGFVYNYLSYEKVSGYFVQADSVYLGIPTLDREVTATRIHPVSGHLYVASIDKDSGGDARIDHFRPTEGGREFQLAESLADPSQELAGRTRKNQLSFSADGRHLYATFGGEPLGLFAVDGGSGALTWLPRAAGLASRYESPFKAVSVLADEAYVLTSGAVLQVREQAGELALLSTLELDGWTSTLAPRVVRDLALARDGRLGVVASSNDLAVVARDPQTGALQLLAATGVRLPAPFRDLEISPSGRYVYALTDGGTEVYELRGAPELAFVQHYPETGTALRMAPNGAEILYVKGLAGPPAFAARSPVDGSLSPKAFQSDSPLPASIDDAAYAAAGNHLYFFHSHHGAPNPVAPIEVLDHRPDGGWRRIAFDFFSGTRLGIQILDPSGRYVYHRGGSGLLLRGLEPAASDYAVRTVVSFEAEALESAGSGFSFPGDGRTLEPLALLAGGDPLLLVNPASGNLQLFRHGCGWAFKKPCLAGRRFEVEVDWHDAQGAAHPAQVEAAGSDNSQIFTFFDPTNWELLVKVLDGCGLNQRFWVFAAASTDVGFDIRVRDSWTGELKVYPSPAGAPAPAITDIGAFATCDAANPGSTPDPPYFPALDAGPVIRLANQFDVKVRWTDHQGKEGEATGLVKSGTYNESGLFYFFDPSNWEMQVKVLTGGCSFNGHFWVLASATTDVGYELEIHDPYFDRTRIYRNPVGRASPAIIDLQAFPCD